MKSLWLLLLFILCQLPIHAQPAHEFYDGLTMPLSWTTNYSQEVRIIHHTRGNQAYGLMQLGRPDSLIYRHEGHPDIVLKTGHQELVNIDSISIYRHPMNNKGDSLSEIRVHFKQKDNLGENGSYQILCSEVFLIADLDGYPIENWIMAFHYSADFIEHFLERDSFPETHVDYSYSDSLYFVGYAWVRHGPRNEQLLINGNLMDPKTNKPSFCAWKSPEQKLGIYIFDDKKIKKVK